MPYRQLQGMLSETLNYTPSYSTIHRRLTGLNVQITGAIPDKDSRQITYTVDATGLKVSNRSEWIRQKWKIRRGFIKMHILTDIDTGIILALKITDESVGDSKMFKALLDDVVNKTNSSDTKRSLLADGAYASRKIHNTCKQCDIKPLIRLRTDSTARGRVQEMHGE